MDIVEILNKRDFAICSALFGTVCVFFFTLSGSVPRRQDIRVNHAIAKSLSSLLSFFSFSTTSRETEKTKFPFLDPNEKKTWYYTSPVSFLKPCINFLPLGELTCLITSLLIAGFVIRIYVGFRHMDKGKSLRGPQMRLASKSADHGVMQIAFTRAIQAKAKEHNALRKQIGYYKKMCNHYKECKKENHENCILRHLKENPEKNILEKDIIRRDKKIKELQNKKSSLLEYLIEHHNKLCSYVQDFKKPRADDQALSRASAKNNVPSEKHRSKVTHLLKELGEFIEERQKDASKTLEEFSDTDEDDTLYGIEELPYDEDTYYDCPTICNK